MNNNLIILFLLTPWVLWGQNQSIQGVVQDTDQPLSFVTILLTPASESQSEPIAATITDDQGRFQLEGLLQGQYTLSVQMLGYEQWQTIVDLSGPIDLGVIELASSQEELMEVTIQATQPKITRAPGRLMFRVASSTLSTTDTYNIVSKTPGVVLINGQITVKNRPTTIYLNNKKVYVSGPELKDFLQGLDAKLIETVEVITNPGANYDADASTVLNIVTNKNINPGYKGSVRGQYRQGVFAKHQWSTTHLFSADKHQWYASYSIAPKKENKNQQTYIRYLSPTTEQTQNIWEGDFNRVTDQLRHQAYAQWTWTPSSTQHISLSAQTVLTPNKQFNNLQENRILTPVYLTQQSFITKSTTDLETSDHVIDLLWRLEFDDRTTLKTLGQYIDYDQKQNQQLNSVYFNPSGEQTSQNTFQTDSRQATQIGLLQMDLNHKAKNTSWDFGAKTTFVDNKTSWSLTSSLEGSNQVETFDYDERVYAAYARMEGQFGEWALSSGLRYEETEVIRESTQSQIPKWRYYNWFPELILSQELPNQQSWGLGYVKKIQRPRYQSLNPFRYYLNESNYNQGNPNLVPAIEQKFNLFYTIDRWWYFEAYYQKIDNALEIISFQDNENQVYRQTDVNIEDYYQYSFDVSFTKNMNRTWFTNLIASAYYISNTFIAEESGGQSVINSTPGVFLQAYNQWSLGSGKGRLEWTNTYISDLVSGSLDYSNMFESSLSYQRTLIPKTATLTIGVDDLFNTKNVAVRSVYLNQDNNYMPRPESRMIWMALRYGFGDNPREHRRSLKDHQERSRLN